MNEPNIQDLPTRDEVIRFLGRQKGTISAVYDETGKRVHLGGRDAGDTNTPVRSESDRRARCAICDAPSGEVTLMRVDEHSALAAELRATLGTSAIYTCFGGNCAKQRNNALMRSLKGLTITNRRRGR